MDALSRILTRIRKNTTSVPCKYKCALCKDTGWILEKNAKYQPTAKKCKCQLKNENEKQWATFGIDPASVKSLGEYNTYDEKTSKAKQIISNYIFNYNKNENKKYSWVALLEQPGAGKSHLIQAAGGILIKQNVNCVYMPYTEVIQALKGQAAEYEKYMQLLEKFKKAEVLIIDDLFKEKIKNGVLIHDLNEVDSKHIYPLLNYRYNNNLNTIISSEATPEMLMQLDRALCGRILEKCNNNIIVFKGNQYDYRLNKFMGRA